MENILHNAALEWVVLGLFFIFWISRSRNEDRSRVRVFRHQQNTQRDKSQN